MIDGPLLIVAPHPDDDVLGCGGLIAKAIAAGQRVRVIYLTSGELGAPGIEADVVLEWRERDARAAAQHLGIDGVEFWEEPDGSLAVRDDLVLRLLDAVNEYQPARVFVTHARDAHPDHQAAHALVTAAVCATQSRWPPFPVVMTYEVWTPMSEYSHVEDITDHINQKLAALRLHESQVSRIAFDDAILGLARYRGELHNRPHGKYAEVFGSLT